MKRKGTVYLVGAGPGDAGLITLRGAELLKRADVVVYDVLVNPALLRLTPATTELIRRGKTTEAGALSQDDMNRLMVERAKAGQCVVRLKGGDPYVFGRGGEEAEFLAAAKIPFEVVPGVSALSAVPNYAGIPLTHRDHCSSFAVFTGHAGLDAVASNAELDQIAGLPGTKVVMMGMKHLPMLTESLRKRGVPPQTPAAVVQWGTTGRQQSVAGTLSNIARLVEEKRLAHPAILILGEVVRLRGTLNWFERRPLLGQRVVVTRAGTQAGPTVQHLSELGADVLELPCIRFAPPDEKTGLVEALSGLGEYDWIVFTSANGVTTFFDYFFKVFDDVRSLGLLRIAAVGPGTETRLRELHLKADLVPKEARAVKAAEALAAFEDLENLRVLLMRAQKANRELPRILEEKGAIVDDIACYQTLAETDDRCGDAARLQAEGADWILFTSGSTVEHFHERFDLPKLRAQFPRLKLASIGPETTKAITALGFKPTLEAKEHTLDGIIKALLASSSR